MRIQHKPFLLLISCLALLIGPVPNAYAENARSTVQALVLIFKNWSGNAADRRTYDQAAKYIDYENMSRRALGQDEWDKLKPSQHFEFVSALRTAIEQRYYPRWHRLFGRGSITYGQESTANGDIVLPTSLEVNQKSQAISWCLESKNGQLKVVSLGVKDKDLLDRLHKRLMTKLHKTSFAGLIAWLKSKASQDGEALGSETAAVPGQEK